MTRALQPTHLDEVSYAMPSVLVTVSNEEDPGGLPALSATVSRFETQMDRRNRWVRGAQSAFVYGSFAAGLILRSSFPHLDRLTFIPFALPYIFSYLVYFKDWFTLSRAEDKVLDDLRYSLMILKGRADAKVEQIPVRLLTFREALENGDAEVNGEAFELGRLACDLTELTESIRSLLKRNPIQRMLNNPLTPVLRLISGNFVVQKDIAEFLIDQGVIDPKKFIDPTYTLERELVSYEAHVKALREVIGTRTDASASRPSS